MSDKKDNGMLPCLRFPEFARSEPWVQNRLESFAFIFKGKGISKADVVPNGRLPCIRYGELYTHYNEVIDDIRSSTDLSEEDLILSHENDVIIPGSGETHEDIAKASCVVRGGIALGGDINIIRSSLNGVFLSYLLNHVKKNQIAKLAQGVSVIHLYPHQIKELSIYVPSLYEQKKIADCLYSVDVLIEVSKQKLDLLKTYKKSLARQLFPDPAAVFQSSRFPEYRNENTWKADILENVVDVIDGDRGANYPNSDDFRNFGYCVFLNAKNVTKEGFVFREVQFIDKAKSESLRKGKLKRLDIVLTTRGSVGQFAFFSNDITFDHIRINSGMVILRVNDQIIEPDYLYQYCKSIEISTDIKNLAFGNAQQQLTVALIKNLPVRYPSRVEQRKISDFLAVVDRLIFDQHEKVNLLEIHKKGLIQQLFTDNNIMENGK